jgi:hypothetical protein
MPIKSPSPKVSTNSLVKVEQLKCVICYFHAPIASQKRGLINYKYANEISAL